MTWIELHDTVIDHPKVLDASDALGISNITLVGHLAAMWTWAIDSAPGGGSLSARAIASGARWAGDKDVFAEALVAVRLLERDGDRYRIHDWDEYTSKLTDKRELRRASNREAQRRRRERIVTTDNADNQRRVTDDNADSDGTRHADNDDSQHPTVPNLTVPNHHSDSDEGGKPKGKVIDLRSGQESGVRHRLWDVYTQLTMRLTPSPVDEQQFELWEANGLTIEQIDGALTDTVAASPERAWPYFKTVLGDRIAKAAVPEKPKPPTLTAAEVQALREARATR